MMSAPGHCRPLPAAQTLGTALAALLLPAILLPAPVDAADLILAGGHVYTAEAAMPRAEAVVVDGHRIVFVGSAEEAMAYRTADTRVIDTNGKMVMPGFHDAHLHTFMGGRSVTGCDVASAPDVPAVEAILQTCAAQLQQQWLIAEGLNLGLFGQAGPTLDWLDSISSEVPVLLRASDGHSVAANSLGLQLAQISRETEDPPAGLIERDDNGAPSGTLRESAMALVERHIPTISPEQRMAAMRAAVREMNRFGLTSVFDAWVGSTDIAMFRAMDEQGALSLRVRAALAYGHGELFTQDSPDVYERQLRDRDSLSTDRFKLAAVKLFIDGVLEGETAALVSPYLGNPGYRGELTYPQDELNRIVADLVGRDIQVYTHALGDGGVRSILDALEFAQQTHGPKDLRPSISHLQLIHPDDQHRFAALGAVANFQALWALPDEWIINLNLPVVGIDRVHRMYPIASIVATGAMIVGGSDWSVSSLNPLDAIEVAVLRQDWLANDDLPTDQLNQLDVLNRSERVSLDTMLRAYTINAAWAMHQDQETGSLAAGKLADLVVLSEDLFAIPPQRISTVRVEHTFVDGEQVYPIAAGAR